MFSPSLFKLLHLQSKNTCKNRKTNITNFEKNRKQQETTDIHYFPARTWEIFIRGRVEGWISCISVFHVFLEVFLFYFCFFLFLNICFRLVYLSFCIYNRTNSYKNRQHIKRFEKKTQSKLKIHVCLISVFPCLFLVNSSKSYHICFTQVKQLTTTKHT